MPPGAPVLSDCAELHTEGTIMDLGIIQIIYEEGCKLGYFAESFFIFLFFC